MNFYSIDTSALIKWWEEDYPPDVLPGLVPLMENLVSKGRLKAVRNVKDEIGTGELKKWCMKQNGLFVDEDEAIQMRVKELMAIYQNPKKSKGIRKADPFVIALADIQVPKWTVVSAENGGSLSKNPSIPIVCQDIRVQHVHFLELLRLENWKL